MLKFRKNNDKNSITGLLLYSEGAFLQLFEGEDKPVDKLMKKIQKDNIHHSIIILVDKTSDKRVFPDWSMGFESVPIRQFKEVKQLIQPVVASSAEANPTENHPIISYFKRFMVDSVKKLQNT